MSGGYDAPTDALQAHAGTLARLADELGQALGTAAAVELTGDAYGQVGQRLAAALNALAGVGQAALRAGVDALEAAGETTTATVAAYLRQDEAGADALNAMGDELA